MNIPENILSTLTDEQKKAVKQHNPRKNSWPWRRKPDTNCPRNNSKASREDGALIAGGSKIALRLFKRFSCYCSVIVAASKVYTTFVPVRS